MESPWRTAGSKTVIPSTLPARWGAGNVDGITVFEPAVLWRSEEHTSELQSQSNLVCRLLLEKKKKNIPPDSRCPLPNCISSQGFHPAEFKSMSKHHRARMSGSSHTINASIVITI